MLIYQTLLINLLYDTIWGWWITIESTLEKHTKVGLHSLARSTASACCAYRGKNRESALMVFWTNSNELRPDTCRISSSELRPSVLSIWPINLSRALCRPTSSFSNYFSFLTKCYSSVSSACCFK